MSGRVENVEHGPSFCLQLNVLSDHELTKLKQKAPKIIDIGLKVSEYWQGRIEVVKLLEIKKRLMTGLIEHQINLEIGKRQEVELQKLLHAEELNDTNELRLLASKKEAEERYCYQMEYKQIRL